MSDGGQRHPGQKVPRACAGAWKPYLVTTVPGQDLMRQTPPFPALPHGPGVSEDEAARLGVALWRTVTLNAFALGIRQVAIVDEMGPNLFYRRASQEVVVV